MRTFVRTGAYNRYDKAPLGKLTEYEKKRDAARTNEPFGDGSEGKKGALRGRFVFHQHAATNLHWDLRLEIDGVLTSFAVPKGPSLDPEVKHLAVHTEDHPIEYLDFEDVIPEGNYGAGPMIVWDRGTVAYLEGPAEEEVKNGKIDFFLRGQKLRGRFALVKLKKEKSQWLLFKKRDDYATGDSIDELNRSVLSGMRVEELAHRDEIEAKIIAHAKRAGAKAATPPPLPRVATLRKGGANEWKSKPNDFIDMQITGARVLIVKSGESTKIFSAEWQGTSAPIELSHLCPELTRSMAALPLDSFAMEGEIVVFDDHGYGDISLLRARATDESAPLDLSLTISDALFLGPLDMRPLPLETRREIIERFLPERGFIRPSQAFRGRIDDAIQFATAHKLTGVVAKRADSAYADNEWLSVSTGGTPNLDALVVSRTIRERDVKITNPNKILFPEVNGTKSDLAHYYEAVAPFLLPYLNARPVALVRYPDGVNGNSFFQWNPPPAMPDWVRTVLVPGEEKPLRGFLLSDVRSLRYVANLAAIPLHILAFRTSSIHNADFATIDFDVNLSSLANGVILAQTLHELLTHAKLPHYPKTSGQSGLHVLIPLGPERSFDTARSLADLLGRALVDRHPDIATMERIVNRRGAKVYVDTGQTGPSRTIVSPYSVRAVATAMVSTPLRWEEVNAKLDPSVWTMKTVPDRLKREGDPMASLLEDRPDLEAAIERLAQLL